MGLYRKTYLCICEGQQEELYLKHVASLLKRLPERMVTFNTMVGDPCRLNKTYTEYDNVAFLIMISMILNLRKIFKFVIS